MSKSDSQEEKNKQNNNKKNRAAQSESDKSRIFHLILRGHILQDVHLFPGRRRDC